MKKFAILYPLCGLLALAACQPKTDSPATNSNAAVSVPTPVDAGNGLADGTVVDEKVRYSAEAAYNVAASAYIAADGRGLLTPELRAKVKPIMTKAEKALKLARAAYSVGDAAGLALQAKAVADLAGTARAMLP